MGFDQRTTVDVVRADAAVVGALRTRVAGALGESERTAQLRVQQEGLELAGIAEVRSADYPADAGIAQTPAAKLPVNTAPSFM